MFSPQIVASEEFLTMPISSQALYFHLGMNADDDGFVQPKVIMRSIGSGDDDLKVLLTKRFLLHFESGVVVIKHWLIHNLIQKDRYHPTRFQDEKKALYIKENKAYTDSVNKMLPEVRLGKDRLLLATRVETIVSDPDKEEREKYPRKTTEEMHQVFDLFSDNPARKLWHRRVGEREAAQVLYDEWGLEELRKRYAIARKYRNEQLCPQINSPIEFLEKMPKMGKFLKDMSL